MQNILLYHVHAALLIITLCACARGKVISCVVIVVVIVVSTKIATSRDVGI